MKSTPTATKMLPKPVRAMHWLSALAIVLALGLAWLHDLFDDKAVSDWIIGMHRQLGLLVLSLWLVRLIVRWYHREHSNGVVLPVTLRLAGAASHFVMYLTLLAMPLLGWAMTNARGHPVLALNIFTLPTLVATDPDLADTLQDWHGWGAWILITLVSAHVLAALYHHWVRRDNVLAAMLPLSGLVRRVNPSAPDSL